MTTWLAASTFVIILAATACDSPARLQQPQRQPSGPDTTGTELPVGGQILVHRANENGTAQVVVSSVVSLVGPDGQLHDGRFIVVSVLSRSGGSVSGGHWVSALGDEKWGGGGGGASLFLEPSEGQSWGMVRDETDLEITGSVVVATKPDAAH